MSQWIMGAYLRLNLEMRWKKELIDLRVKINDSKAFRILYNVKDLLIRQITRQQRLRIPWKTVFRLEYPEEKFLTVFILWRTLSQTRHSPRRKLSQTRQTQTKTFFDSEYPDENFLRLGKPRRKLSQTRPTQTKTFYDSANPDEKFLWFGIFWRKLSQTRQTQTF